MKLIKPSYEILTSWDFIKEQFKNIELAGRCCWKSEDKITDNSYIRFIDMLVNDKHHGSVIEHSLITVKFIIDRGVSHELVRHRIVSYSQESTRYCNYSKDKFGNELTFILPPWISDQDLITDRAACAWQNNLENIEKDYIYLMSDECEWKAQQARSILPNSLKTEIVVSTNFREWRHILKLRTSSAAHPQIREVMIPLLEEFKKNIPVIFDDIKN
jgi:thymidylate synthase (FAD)